MSYINNEIYYKCNQVFIQLDSPTKCDGCNLFNHNKCFSLTVNEMKCLSLKNRC